MPESTAPLAGDWTNLVVLCAATPWDGHRLPDQYVATSLLRFAPVLYVDPPVSPLTASRHPAVADVLAEPPLRRVGPRLARLTPRVLPAKERPGMKIVTDLLTRRALRQAIRTMGAPRVRAVIVSSFNPLFGACNEQVRVFYAEDDYVAGAELMGIASVRLRRGEARQLADAQLVVAASAELAHRYRHRAFDVLAMPNGCDAALGRAVDAAPHPDDVTLPAPIAGVVGTLNDRLDLASLQAVAASGLSLLLVGPRAPTFPQARLAELLEWPNVQWVGARSAAELPSYLRAIDVGLVPYRDTAFNRASFPLKTLEYLSAGRPVVATDLPAIRWLDTDLVTVGQDRDAFANAAARLAAAPLDREAIEERRAFAAGHTWDRRVDSLAYALGLASRPGGSAALGAATNHETADRHEEPLGMPLTGGGAPWP